MTNLNYCLWLHDALGPGADNVGQIFDFYSSAEEIFKESEKDRKLSGVFKENQIYKMSSSDIEETYETISKSAKAGIDIVTFKDSSYPENLLRISDFPILLFVKGDLECLKQKIPISIVGTRDPNARSLAASTELSRALSQCGFLVVSGGAVGVDSASHTGALSVGMKTVCVLGTGMLYPYLLENEPLRDVIASNGAVVSEFPLNYPGTKWTFPMRNRIISGISEGTVVIEANKRSGSLNTANHAGSQGRDVFAMPSKGLGSAFAGCDKLIEDGAISVQMPLDVVSEYLTRFPEYIKIDESVDLSIDLTTLGLAESDLNKRISKIVTEQEEKNKEFRDRKKPKKRDITEPLSEDAKKLYAAFDRDPLSIKELVEKVFMPTKSLLGALTELEIYGYIELLPNTKYVVK